MSVPENYVKPSLLQVIPYNASPSSPTHNKENGKTTENHKYLRNQFRFQQFHLYVLIKYILGVAFSSIY